MKHISGGRTNGSTANYRYNYNYTDHLGNIRLTYTKEPSANVLTILEENNYYPFGLKHQNYNMTKRQYDKDGGNIVIVPTNETVYDYKYNEKEWQDELGLNFYDYHARNYDPAIGRWMNIDPLAEVSRRWSPYNYVYNNPMVFTDPDGMKANPLESGSFTLYGEDAQNFVGGLQARMNSKPDNDITVNSNGKVTKVVSNDGPHRIFDENGNQLYLNDYNFDSEWLEGIRTGDQLYNSIDNKMLSKFLLRAGIGMNPWLRFNGLGYLKTAWDSHTVADFGYNQLRDEFGLYYTEYDGYSDGDGSFFRIQGQKSIYNLADFGQFLWGAWMKSNGYISSEAKAGAHINNFISTILSVDRSGGVLDSAADQRAIQNGYNYMQNLISQWRK